MLLSSQFQKCPLIFFQASSSAFIRSLCVFDFVQIRCGTTSWWVLKWNIPTSLNDSQRWVLFLTAYYLSLLNIHVVGRRFVMWGLCSPRLVIMSLLLYRDINSSHPPIWRELKNFLFSIPGCEATLQDKVYGSLQLHPTLHPQIPIKWRLNPFRTSNHSNRELIPSGHSMERNRVPQLLLLDPSSCSLMGKRSIWASLRLTFVVRAVISGHLRHPRNSNTVTDQHQLIYTTKAKYRPQLNPKHHMSRDWAWSWRTLTAEFTFDIP